MRNNSEEQLLKVVSGPMKGAVMEKGSVVESLSRFTDVMTDITGWNDGGIAQYMDLINNEEVGLIFFERNAISGLRNVFNNPGTVDLEDCVGRLQNLDGYLEQLRSTGSVNEVISAGVTPMQLRELVKKRGLVDETSRDYQSLLSEVGNLTLSVVCYLEQQQSGSIKDTISIVRHLSETAQLLPNDIVRAYSNDLANTIRDMGNSMGLVEEVKSNNNWKVFHRLLRDSGITKAGLDWIGANESSYRRFGGLKDHNPALRIVDARKGDRRREVAIRDMVPGFESVEASGIRIRDIGYLTGDATNAEYARVVSFATSQPEIIKNYIAKGAGINAKDYRDLIVNYSMGAIDGYGSVIGIVDMLIQEGSRSARLLVANRSEWVNDRNAAQLTSLSMGNDREYQSLIEYFECSSDLGKDVILHVTAMNELGDRLYGKLISAIKNADDQVLSSVDYSVGANELLDHLRPEVVVVESKVKREEKTSWQDEMYRDLETRDERLVSALGDTYDTLERFGQENRLRQMWQENSKLLLPFCYGVEALSRNQDLFKAVFNDDQLFGSYVDNIRRGLNPTLRLLENVSGNAYRHAQTILAE